MIKDVLEKYKERIPVRVLAELLAEIDEAEAVKGSNKQIFDWLREQIADEINVPTLIRKDYDFDDGLIHARDLINEAEAKFGCHAICYLDSPCEYQNEDIRVEEVDITCCEWEKLHHYRFIYSPHEKNQGIWEEELANKPFCPYCGKPIKVSEVE